MSVAAIIAIGVNGERTREVFVLTAGASEAEPFWIEFLRGVTRRRLKGVHLLIFDAHTGLKAAIVKIFKASWQPCRTHFLRNVLAFVGKDQWQIVLAMINAMFLQKQQRRRMHNERT